MIEVFVLGVFVAYVKLGGLVEIGLRTGVYALLALTIVLVWVDAALDREKVWERLDHEDRPDALRAMHGDAVEAGADRLRDLRPGQRAASPGPARCPRCEGRLHPRRPTASRAPGPWSSPPRSSTSRPITIRC